MTSIYTVIPFLLMLLSIAIIPLINKKWWHKNFPTVSIIIGLPVAIAVAFVNWHWLLYTFIEYASFITLLASLFIISGGILVKENLKISPLANVVVLIIGAVLANLIGTTGAAMLLIRPLISMNKERKKNVHLIVFFIFIVANIGGCLTPLGDPPLFLGFLKGVPFLWTLKMLPAWVLNNAILVTLFFFIDYRMLRIEKTKNYLPQKGTPIKIVGKRNFIFLLGVIASTIIYAKLPTEMDPILKNIIQIVAMASMAALSLKYTPQKYRTENRFTWFPIKEVAILFAAIFATIIPILKLLELRGAELGITEPYQFFWATGLLSSFLDNAPTYLAFFSLAKGLYAQSILPPDILLMAISMGAVFMGAITYIGNGPNFMVKSVAEASGIKMPSFFMYMLWSLFILGPIFLLNTLVFFL